MVEGFFKNIKQQNKIIKKQHCAHQLSQQFFDKHPEIQTIEHGTKPIKFNPVDPSFLV